jgi:hypothetical protein
LREGEAAEVASRGQTCLLRREGPEFYIMISFRGVCVGIDGDEDASLYRIADPSPVHIETAGMRIQFYHRVVFRTGIDYLFMVDRVTGAAEQQAAGHMPQDRGIGVGDGVEQAGHGLVFAHL